MALSTKLDRFAFVTVMKPTIYVLDAEGTETGTSFVLDSLRISNITQEGPSKTAKGGLFANTLLRYGKTTRLEMEDVIGRSDVLLYLLGATSKTTEVLTHTDTFVASALNEKVYILTHEVKSPYTIVAKVNGAEDGSAVLDADHKTVIMNAAIAAGNTITVAYSYDAPTKISITNKFNLAVKIVGSTFVIDENGDKQWVYITIPKFLPDSLFNMTMEAEGDFGVISLAGEVQANDCGEFYYFSDDVTSHDCA